MKTRDILVIFLSSVFLICSCATYKQTGFSSELLGTWLYEFETPEGFHGEQTYTFNLNGTSIMETSIYGHINILGDRLRFLRPQDIFVIDLFSSSKKGRIYFNNFDYISYKIDDGYLFISGITYNLFNQSLAKYRKLSETEVEQRFKEKEKYLRIGRDLDSYEVTRHPSPQCPLF